MEVQFTQQILIDNKPATFLFTEKSISDTECIYIISILNNPSVQPFTMALHNDHFEIVDEANVPEEIKNLRYQLNQSIHNYHIMQSLLSGKSPLSAILKSEKGEGEGLL